MRPSITAYGNGADRRTASLRQMTVDQLLDLGTSRVAYLRSGMWDLATVDSVETAVEVAAEHGLAFISVH